MLTVSCVASHTGEFDSSSLPVMLCLLQGMYLPSESSKLPAFWDPFVTCSCPEQVRGQSNGRAQRPPSPVRKVVLCCAIMLGPIKRRLRDDLVNHSWIKQSSACLRNYLEFFLTERLLVIVKS